MYEQNYQQIWNNHKKWSKEEPDPALVKNSAESSTEWQWQNLEELNRQRKIVFIDPH
jgi:hypothetical protein